MKAPIHRLKKAEIQKLSNGQCRHAHSYLDHYNCYLTENPEEVERVGFFDLEASNLDADFGQMLSYCIKDSNSKEILGDIITKNDLVKNPPGQADKRIVRNCIRDLSKFDRIVTFYGARFDLPFLRTRAAVCGVDFPTYGSLSHKDLWFVIRGKYKLSSNRLQNACKVILGKTNKTHIEPKHWHGALQGNKKSLKYIYEHNCWDVLDLQDLYERVESFSRPSNNSI